MTGPTMWHCDTCGSTEITQEVQTMVLVNNPTTPPKHMTCVDFYWCPTCDDECHPTEKVI